MKKTFTIEFDDALFEKTMQELGYQATIKTYEAKSVTVPYEEFQANNDPLTYIQDENPLNITIQNFDQENPPAEITINYQILKEIPNPKSADEFLKELFLEKFVKPIFAPIAVKLKTEQIEKQLEEARKQAEEELKANTNIDVV